MYALMLVRYRRPLPEIEAVTQAHRAYLRTLKEQGVLLASGPMDPRNGGMFLLRHPRQRPLLQGRPRQLRAPRLERGDGQGRAGRPVGARPQTPETMPDSFRRSSLMVKGLDRLWTVG
jgi:YCII-related domain